MDGKVSAELLYIATLGHVPWSWRSSAAWRQEVVDLEAKYAGRRLVRLLALGEGIEDQSVLGIAADFASSTPGWTRKQWVGGRSRVDMRRVLLALAAQHRRDVEQAAFEGVAISRTTCVIAVGDAPMGVAQLGAELAELAGTMTLVWVSAGKRDPRLPTTVPGRRLLTWHPELGAEVGRALGVGVQRLDDRLLERAEE
jgi:hypothetical protein